MPPNVIGGKKRLIGTFLGCFLGLAASGCSLHRAGQGQVSGSQWTPSWLMSRSAQNADACAADCGCGGIQRDCIVSQRASIAADKPELLPWRSRLRGYRLGSRLGRGRGSVDEDYAVEPAALPSTEMPAAEQAPLPSGHLARGEDSSPAAKPTSVDVPDPVAARPEPMRPDIVVE